MVKSWKSLEPGGGILIKVAGGPEGEEEEKGRREQYVSY